MIELSGFSWALVGLSRNGLYHTDFVSCDRYRLSRS